MIRDAILSNLNHIQDLPDSLRNNDIALIVRDHTVYKAKGEQLKSTNGWAYYQDSQYISGSPLVSNNAKTQLTINGEGANTETSYLGSFFDHWVDNKILTENVGDNYIVRLDWKVKSSANNILFDVVFDIGTDETPIVIVEQTHSFRKGDNATQRYSKTVSLFALETFKENGCRVFIDTSDSGANIEIFDMALKIERTYI